MIYELRIYTVHPGKLNALLTRFRDHTRHIFARNGLTNVGYWLNPIEGQDDDLYYMLSFEDVEQREQAWAAFRADPEWARARDESERDGPLIKEIRSQIMTPTDFSPLK